jgi:large subunit ribosomal protein L6
MASLMGQSQKKIIRRILPMYLLNDLKTKNKYINKINKFYVVLNKKEERKKKKKINFNFLTIQKKIIGIFAGFKKKIRLRGIGYKFSLNGRILTFRIGFTHTFSILLSTLLYNSFNKKKTKLLIRFNHFNQITTLLSAFQNIKKPDVYTGKGIRYNLKKFKLKEGKKKKF